MLTRFIGLLFASILALISSNIYAQNSCKPKGIDVCKLAQRFANEMSSSLPIKLNQNLSFQTAFAIENHVNITAMLSYDKSFLNQTLITSGVTEKQMLDVIRKIASSSMCAEKSPAKAFIDYGGVVRTIYRFSDGNIYAEVITNSCM